MPADYRNGDAYDGLAVQWYDTYADFVALLADPRVRQRRCSLTRPASSTCSGMIILFTEEAEVFIWLASTMGTDRGTVTGADGVTRCWWCGDDPLYVDYHDHEWGRPLRDERALFELLCLEGFQAGLSWITILRKRVAFREAFDGFDVARVARYDEADVLRLLAAAWDRSPPREDHRHHRQRPSRGGDAARLARRLTQIVWSHAPVARRRRSWRR